MEVVGQLGRGRDAYIKRRWVEAFESLASADQAVPLEARDLELLATAAYMLGRDGDYLSGLERAHRAYRAACDLPRAARCAFWIGASLMLRGAMGRAMGWFGRARRLLERDGRDCVECGYLLLARMFEREAVGDREAAIAAAEEALAIGERFGDADLMALAAHDQGLLLIKQRRVTEGLGLLDEAMVEVTAGEASPIVSGLVYCGVIMGCQAAFEPRRAREWIAAFAQWCQQQPDMVSFTATCQVHRAEIMQLRGAWPEALREVRRTAVRCAPVSNEPASAQAAYRRGEIHRLQGDFTAAAAAYREARRGGADSQPGLALLRLAEGHGRAAAAAIRRVLGETPEPSRRATLVPAEVDITLAVGDVASARRACEEIQELAACWPGPMMGATAAFARGAVQLAAEDAGAALVALRQAWRSWCELEAPYEAARARVLIAVACRALGDDETAALELEAAREVFAWLGAEPDVARVDSLTEGAAPLAAHALTARELEVLRLVAVGKRNRQVASALVISEHTVARHLQNIFAKLGVSSRTAASAFAFTHELL